MSYKSVEDLPDGLRRSLSLPAQQLYLSTYNQALESFLKQPPADSGTPEQAAHRQAWAAVKKRYSVGGR